MELLLERQVILETLAFAEVKRSKGAVVMVKGTFILCGRILQYV